MLKLLASLTVYVISGAVILGTNTKSTEAYQPPAARDRELDRNRNELVLQLANHQEQARQLQDAILQLKLREADLRSDVETAELDDDREKAKKLRREQVQLEHALQRLYVEKERSNLIDQRLRAQLTQEAERRELLSMTDRLEYVATWRDIAFEPPQAVMMATQSVVELHLASGDVEGAAVKLEALLERIQDKGSRTAIRFALKDLYVDLGKLKRAGNHMIQVILENSQTGPE